MDYEVVAKGIVHFPKAITDAKNLIETIENTEIEGVGDWLPWLSHGDDSPHQYGMLKQLDISKLKSEPKTVTRDVVQNAIDEINETLDLCFAAYYRHLGVDESTIENCISTYKKDRPSHIAIKKYFVGEELGPHPDSDEDDPTVFTASIYFNSDYVGGALSFPDMGVSVAPQDGSVVIFPSAIIHESLRVSSGDKYVTNILGVVPKSAVAHLL
jgi:hypothetical protein